MLEVFAQARMHLCQTNEEWFQASILYSIHTAALASQNLSGILAIRRPPKRLTPHACQQTEPGGWLGWGGCCHLQALHTLALDVRSILLHQTTLRPTAKRSQTCAKAAQTLGLRIGLKQRKGREGNGAHGSEGEIVAGQSLLECPLRKERLAQQPLRSGVALRVRRATAQRPLRLFHRTTLRRLDSGRSKHLSVAGLLPSASS